MNKYKKVACKKVLVRNTEIGKPKCKVVDEQAINVDEDKVGEEPKRSPAKKQKCSENKPDTSNFSRPNVYSAARIVKKIEELKKFSAKKQIAVDEKITRQINFPQDQVIYQNLIPLCTLSQPHKQIVAVRKPLPNKDPEPSLSDFRKPKKVFSEYRYEPNQILANDENPVRQSNLLKLYTTVQSLC